MEIQQLNAQIQSLKQEASALNKSFEESEIQVRSLRKLFQETSQRLNAAEQEILRKNKQIMELESQNAKLNEDLRVAEEALAAQKTDAERLREHLEEMEREINESINWFRENAVFPASHSRGTQIFAQRIYSDCMEEGDLNLACINYLMENTAFALHYRSDIEGSKKKEDWLQSLDETIRSGWGDCEDYSLLYKSILNLAKQDGKAKSIYGFAPSQSGEFRVYPLESKSSSQDGYWYYPNAKRKNFGELKSSFFYVVCYNRASPEPGHCAVAASKSKIDGPQSAYPALQGAVVFEPQNGEFLGKIGEGFYICKNGPCARGEREIYLVIGDEDMYINSGKGWASYMGYYSMLHEIRQQT